MHVFWPCVCNYILLAATEPCLCEAQSDLFINSTVESMHWVTLCSDTRGHNAKFSHRTIIHEEIPQIFSVTNNIYIWL